VSHARAERYRQREQAIIEAAYRQFRPGATGVSVTEILRETGLSTRAFYRQFESKDELVVKMCRDEYNRMSTRLAAAVASARTPLKAVEAWVGEMLQAGYDPRRSGRTLMFSSPDARSARGFQQLRREGSAMHREILADVIRGGKSSGAFPLADPDNDARAIHAIALNLIEARAFGEPGPSYDEARNHIVGLFGRGVGAPPSGRRAP